MSFYDLTPLNPENREIRLIRLHPGKAEQCLVMDCLVISLNTKSVYKALSYVWGTLDMSQVIIVADSRFMITENLMNALRHVRSEHDSVDIWVDLICINQQDLAEKASQVALMGDIYRQTSEVLVWLGDAYEYPNMFEAASVSIVDDAWQELLREIESKYTQRISGKASSDPSSDVETLIRFFGEDQHLHEMPYFEVHEQNGKPRLKYGMAWLEAVFNLHNLASSPWWLRTWTVQEVNLPQVQTFLYGAHHISWSLLQTAVRYMRRHYNGCCNESWHTLASHWDLFDDLNYKVREFYKLDRLCLAAPDLRSIVPHFRTRLSTDPRDKIYGLLSMSAQEQDRVTFKPDYTVKTNDLYTKFAWSALSRDLDYLAEIDFQDRTGSELHLPSWVPDWSVTITEDRYNNQGGDNNPHDIYNASGDERAVLKLVADDVLRTRTVLADRVLSVSGVFNYSFPAAQETMQLYLNFAEINEPRSESALRTPRYSQFWTTMFADVISVYSAKDQEWSVRRTTPDDAELWRIWLNEFSPTAEEDPTEVFYEEGASPEKVRAAQVSISAAAEDRRLFKTAAGRLGLGPRDMAAGDEIHVLFGAHVPFVLRKTGQPASVEDRVLGMYQVLGSCFVHGIMDGEAIKENAPFDIAIV